MTQRQEIIERLNGLEMEGGSHAMLSAICKAVLPHSDAWTLRRCADLRDRLVRLLGEADEEALREAYTKGREDGMGVANAKNAQAEYLRGKNDGYDEGWDAGFASADDWCAQHECAMAERGWVRLPKDADGKPIHIGDKLIDKDDKLQKPAIVKCILYNDEGCVVSDIDPRGCWYDPSLLRHYHAPTVEDVLREFADEVQRCCDTADTIVEYAKRLKLAGDAE